jgi:catechol 2,3-dioxygenase-like lactoylglutathione lyase family enzyme
MNAFLSHGRILGGVVATPDMGAALIDYQGRLGLELIECGTVSDTLAKSWSCPAIAGAAMATLQPISGAHCFVRLVEQAVPQDFKPVRTYGWAAYEMSVQDVYGWPDKLNGSGFTVVGPPKEIEGLPYFVPMQVTGQGREMLYLNEVRQNTPSSDLPPAHSPVDHMFIVILACADMAGAIDWYREKLDLDLGGEYDINYTMINHSFGLPEGTQHKLAMLQKERLPIIEVDGYPAGATVRPREACMLPPGNALVTLAVKSLDDLSVEWITAPTVQQGPLYAGARSATLYGPAGELLELVELG